MKKGLLILWLLIATVCAGFSQSMPAATVTHRYMLNANTIVKDSSGKQYGYNDWTKMMASKNYELIPRGKMDTTNKTPEFLIRPKRSTDQRLPGMTTDITQIKPGSNTDSTKSYTTTRRARIPAKPAESEQFHAGDVFKPFNERDITGQKFDLKKDRGKVYVINFWFINCPPCRAEMPKLNAIVEKYKDNKDVVFIAISLDEKDRIDMFLKLFPYNYHIIEDGRYIAEKYGVNLYPTNVVVNRDGKVAYSSVADQPANPYWITKTIDEALQATYIPATK